MGNYKDTFRCVLTVVSPVHLGCDEAYEPLSFVVDEEHGTMTVSDPLALIASLTKEDLSRFSEICRKGSVESILEIYKFLRNRKVDGRRIDLCSAFVGHYKKVLSLTANEKVVLQSLNQFQISRTAFRPADDRPYIPGSAVKGAIRTAWLNRMAEIKKTMPQNERRRPDGKLLQEQLMEYRAGNMETDPFRLVKVSDFRPVGDVRTRISYAVNKKKKVGDIEARGPYQILEEIEPGNVFIGEISVEKPQSDKYIKSPVPIDGLLEGIRTFYTAELDRENAELNKIGVQGVALEEKNARPLRIGRHSGAESLTVSGHRNIKIMLGRNNSTFLDHATTLWLASESDNNNLNKGLRPFGWTCLAPFTPEIERNLGKKEENYLREKALVEERLSADADTKRAVVERLRMKAEEALRLREQQERDELDRQEKLAAMCPDERDIVTIENPQVVENKVVDLYNRLNGLSDELKVRAAGAMKAYWQQHGKWEKKACSPKQLEKVKKVKQILGE
jgi:CRISPR-associated protein Csm5